MDKKTEQILLGSILGDGCITDKNTYTEVHSLKQENYLLWKNRFLKIFNAIIFRGKHYHKKYKKYYYQIGIRSRKNKLSPILIKYRKLFYPNGKKIIPNEILNQLNPLGLTVWYCDDGCYNYHTNTCMIATPKEFDKSLIQKWFKERWGIDCKFWKDDLGIWFSHDNTKKLIQLIKPHILKMPNCMRYKIGLDENRKKQRKQRLKKNCDWQKERYKTHPRKYDKDAKVWLNPKRKEYMRNYMKIYMRKRRKKSRCH